MALPLTDKLYTAEEFMALTLDPGKRYELIRGRLREMSHPGEEHTLIVGNLSKALWRWVLSQSPEPGRVLPPGAFELKLPGETRDTVRSPDLAFLAEEKVSWQSGAIKVAPDLAVEVYSPNDRPGELQEKLENYAAAGWNVVWVIYPLSATPKKKAGTVEVYHLEEGVTPVKTLLGSDLLQGEGVLDGFATLVETLFK